MSVNDHVSSSHSTGQLVLVTGGTGHLGYRTLVETLQAGYRVRAAVRNNSGIEKIKAAESTRPFLHNLDFIIVPDIEKENAYVEAVKGVDYIIHLASPIASNKSNPRPDEYDALVIQPAIRGTVNILHAAKAHSPTTKRVVITTSVVALFEWNEMFNESGRVHNEQSRTKLVQGPFSNFFEAYGASKVGALLATEEFVKTQKPHFDVNNIAPSFTIGKKELAETAADALVGTNGSALEHALGKHGGPTPSSSIHLYDIARMHVLALHPKVPGGQVFIGVSEDSHTHWEDTFAILKKYFPEAVADGTFPLTGSNPTKKLLIDSAYTRKTLGIELQSYEEQVKSVAGHYLELKAAGL